MTSTDPVLSGIATQSFRLIRKGFDPEEVRAYLEQIADVVASRLSEAEAQAQAAYAAAPKPVVAEVSDEAAVGDARAELQRLLADQAAVRAWFGEEGRPDAVLVPKAVRDAATTATAMVRAAESEAADRLRAAEAEIEARTNAAAVASPAPIDPASPSWEDVGGHVGRILAGAEAEAASIRAAAEEDAQVIRAEADGIRGQADEAIADAARRAEALTGAAQARVAQLNQSAEDEVRAHVAGVLAEAEADLERTQLALDEAHAHMEEIHASVGRVLEQRPARPTLGDPVAAVVSAPLVPGAEAPQGEALTEPSPVPSESPSASPVAEAPAFAGEPEAPRADQVSLGDAGSPQRWAADSPAFSESLAPSSAGAVNEAPSWDQGAAAPVASTEPVVPTPLAVAPVDEIRPSWDPAPTAAPPAPEAPTSPLAPVDAAPAWTPPAPAPAATTASPGPDLRGAEPSAPIPEIPRPVPGVDAFDGRSDLTVPSAPVTPIADPATSAAPAAPRVDELEPSVRAAMGIDSPGAPDPVVSDDDRWSPLRTFGRRLGGAGDTSEPAEAQPGDAMSGLDHLEPSVRAVIEGTDRDRRDFGASFGDSGADSPSNPNGDRTE